MKKTHGKACFEVDRHNAWGIADYYCGRGGGDVWAVCKGREQHRKA